MTLEPIPETHAALRQLDHPQGRDLLSNLRSQAEQVRRLVPECVGISVGVLHRGVTFTLVSTDELAAVLDAVQYVEDGPCVESVREGREVHYDGQLLEEGRWQLFSQATAAVGVRSSLTLPVLVDGRVTGSVNLYASTSTAFDDHHDELAAIFEAWAPGAVSNADLAFDSRRIAGDAADTLRDDRTTTVAVAVIASQRNVDTDTAKTHLEDSARRAGVSDIVFARYVLKAAGLDEQP